MTPQKCRAAHGPHSRDLDEILYDNSHPDISESAPEVHIAFNGRDHYDAVEVLKEGIFTATTSTATPTKSRGLASRLWKESVAQKPLFPQFSFNEELMEAMIVEGGQIAAKDNNAASSNMQVDNSVTTPPRKARTFTAKQSLATDKRMKQQIKTPRVQQQILKRRPPPCGDKSSETLLVLYLVFVSFLWDGCRIFCLVFLVSGVGMVFGLSPFRT